MVTGQLSAYILGLDEKSNIPSSRLPSSLSRRSPKSSWLDSPLISSSESMVVSGGVLRIGGESCPDLAVLSSLLLAEAPARWSVAFLFRDGGVVVDLRGSVLDLATRSRHELP